MLPNAEYEWHSPVEDMVELEETFVPINQHIDQQSYIETELHLPYPKLSTTPINEFNSEGYIAKSFPCIFPYGNYYTYIYNILF